MQQALLRERNPRKRIYLLLSLAEALSHSNIQLAIENALQAVKEADANKQPELIAESLVRAGMIYSTNEDYKRAFSYLNKALKGFKRIGDQDAVLDVELQIEVTKDSSGKSLGVLIPLHRILNARTSGEPTTSPIGEAPQIIIARLWKDRVLGHPVSPSKRENNNQRKIGYIYNLIGRAYSSIADHAKAISFMERGLSTWKSLNDLPLMVIALNDLGTCYIHDDKNKQAQDCFLRSLRINRKLGNKAQSAINLANLSELGYRMKKLSIARRQNAEAVQLLCDVGLRSRAIHPLIGSADNERRIGSVKKADEMCSRALSWIAKDDRGSTFIHGALVKLQIDFARTPTQAIYSECARLYSEAKRKGFEVQHRIAEELSNIAAELGLSSESLQWMRKMHEYELHRVDAEQKQAITRLETEHELERIETERQLHRLKMRQLETELRSKTKEIELLAVHLAKKGSFFSSLIDQLTDLNSADSPEGYVSYEAVRRLIETVQRKDVDFERLEEQALSLYRKFFISLAKDFPQLTQSERRVCILLRLGLNPKEIANVLFTSTRTIENHCLSIRRKLYVPAKTRLPKYLLALESGTLVES